MFKAIFGGSESPAQSRELNKLLSRIFSKDSDSSERRGAAYSLRDLISNDPGTASRLYASLVLNNSDAFADIVRDVDEEEVAQTLLGLLSVAAEIDGDRLAADQGLVELLLELVRNSPLLWVRLEALRALDAFAGFASAITAETILKIPSALEDLVKVLEDSEKDVRNAMLVILAKLTQVDDQIRMFLIFCDATTTLLSIALEEKSSVVSGDAVAVCVNALKNNSVGQKQFLESSGVLTTVASLLSSEKQSSDANVNMFRIGKCIELVRCLCEGRVLSRRPEIVSINNPDTIERRSAHLSLAQERLGSTPFLLEILLAIGSDESGSYEDEIRREAIVALGELVCKTRKNIDRLEALGGFAILASHALTSSRWMDAKHFAYAWLAALDNTENDAEPSVLVILGHAITQLPESYDDGEGVEPTPNAAIFLASALVNALDSVSKLRDELYVEHARVAERAVVVWRAMQLWNSLLISSASKELALRLRVDDREVFAHLIDQLRSLLKEKDETDAVKKLTCQSICFILATLARWVNECRAAAEYILRDASNIFLFEPLTMDPKVRALGAVLDASMLISTWDIDSTQRHSNIVYGLLENRMGIDLFLQLLGSIRTLPQSEIKPYPKESFWADEKCLDFSLDDIGETFVTDLVARVNPIILRGASTAPGKEAPKRPTQTEFVSKVVYSNGDNINGRLIESNTDSEAKLRRLERDYSDLLLVLAHQELERQSLLQTISEIGGEKAVSKALQASAALLKKSLDEMVQ